MGSHPCAWPRSQATLGSYPCSYIVRTPPPDSLYPQSLKKTSFPRIPTYPAGYRHGPSTTPMGSHPCAWPLSLATKCCRMPKNTYFRSHRDTFAQGLPKIVFRETLGESVPVGPKICVFGHPAALCCQRQGPSAGVRPHGCCRGTMSVPCRVGGYPGKTRFFERLWVQRVGGRCSDYV